MRAVWRPAEVQRNDPTDWRFLAGDAKAMRRALDARSLTAGQRACGTGRALCGETTRTASFGLP